MSAADFKSAKTAFDNAIDTFKSQLDHEGTLSDDLKDSKAKRSHVLAGVLDDALTFFKACEGSTEGENFFVELLAGVGALETEAKNPFNAISRYIWLRRFGKAHWDELKGDKKLGATAKVAANKYATVLHRAQTEGVTVAQIAQTEYEVTDKYGQVKLKKGLDACAANWKRTEQYVQAFPSTKTAAQKHETGRAALELLADGCALVPAFVQLADDAEPRVVKLIDLTKHPDLLARLYELFAPKGERGRKKGSTQTAKTKGKVASLLKPEALDFPTLLRTLSRFAGVAGSDYAVRAVADDNGLTIRTGKRGTRNSVFAEMHMPKREDVAQGEYVITAEAFGQAQSILGTFGGVTAALQPEGLVFTFTQRGQAPLAGTITNQFDEAMRESWIVGEATITIPLPKPDFSMPTISTKKLPNWLSPHIPVTDELLGKIKKTDGKVKKASPIYTLRLSSDSFSIAPLSSDDKTFEVVSVPVSDGPERTVSFKLQKGLLPRLIEQVQAMSGEAPVALTLSETMAKVEAGALTYFVPTTEAKDVFDTVNVEEWNGKQVVRRAV